jgi:hypothetical protein
MYGNPIQRTAWIPPQTVYRPRRRKSLGWVMALLMVAMFSGIFSNHQQNGHSAVFTPTPNFQPWQVNAPQANVPQVNVPPVYAPRVNPPQVYAPQVNIPQMKIPQPLVAPQIPQRYYPANQPPEYPTRSPDSSDQWRYAPQQAPAASDRRN